MIVMGVDALEFVNGLGFPLARPLAGELGALQQFTPTIEALAVPDIDSSLDENAVENRVLERLQAGRALVGRTSALLAAALFAALFAYDDLAYRLWHAGLWWNVAWIACVLMPATFALVLLALPLRQMRHGCCRSVWPSPCWRQC